MLTERLYIHRAEPAKSEKGGVSLQPVPEEPAKFNLGITYKMHIVKADEHHARCYGMETGYAGCGECGGIVPTVQAELYAPKGFSSGNLVLVTLHDDLMKVSHRDMSSVDAFLDALDKAEIEDAIAELQGFSFAAYVR